MAVINRNSVAAPVLPKETVTVDALGGDVVVCGLRLTDRLALQARMRKLRGNEGIEQSDAGVDPSIAIVPELLAMTVLDADGLSVFTVEQWQVFGATQQNDALNLFNLALSLSGFDGEAAAKN